jgi:hypothetical protein
MPRRSLTSSPPGLTRWSMLKCNFSSHTANLRKRRCRMDCRVKPGNDEQKSFHDACDSLSPAGRGWGEGARPRSICSGLRAPSSCPSPPSARLRASLTRYGGEGTKLARRAPLFGSEADRVSNLTLAAPVRPSFAKAKFTKSHSHEKPRAFRVERREAPGSWATPRGRMLPPAHASGVARATERSACANRLLRARCASRRSTTIAVLRRGCRPPLREFRSRSADGRLFSPASSRKAG